MSECMERVKNSAQKYGPEFNKLLECHNDNAFSGAWDKLIAGIKMFIYIDSTHMIMPSGRDAEYPFSLI